MSVSSNLSTADTEQTAFNRVTGDLTRQGWAVCERFLSQGSLAGLAGAIRKLWEQGRFHKAGIGRKTVPQLHSDIRGDYILWLEDCATPVISRFVAQELESLRQALNAATYLGLYEFEGHLAVYPPGCGYARHVDQFRNAQERLVSLVLYLNEGWRAEEGGELCLYPPSLPQGRSVAVPPIGGTLAVFLSAEMPHEVLPATRYRFSLSGWFRSRS
ncbi:MAG: 2OG-Fe(II) oxygenase [Gammaproteobacteria bacterium]